jgi:preprotein translocase subunit SecE
VQKADKEKKMNKLTQFFKESYEEMKSNVSWPSRLELQNSATLVLVASLLFALVIGLVDLVFKNGLTWFYQSF